MNIKRHLNTGNYEKALAILKAAVVTWPHYSMFSSSHERDKTGEPSENKRYVFSSCGTISRLSF